MKQKILEAKNFLNAQDAQDAQDSNNASDPIIFNDNSFIVTLKKVNTDFMAVAKFDASIVPRGAFCAFIINAFIASVGIALIAALGAAATPLTIGTFTIAGAAMVFIVELCKQSAFA
ncbi:6953_t:CDS:2, partial [Gigaspora margarita]